MRFRLKTEFLTYAHSQIRGGLWYKPTWWEAVQKVPPTAVVPRIQKKFIPRIRFIEDKLMREFTARNPALRAVDARNFARGRTSSVASEFVSEQLRHMRADRSEAASYDVAARWLVENGPAVLRKVDAKLLGDGATSQASVPPADTFERVMGMQTELLREALQQEEAMRTGRAERALPPHRTFLSADEVTAIAQRTRRSAPRMGGGSGSAAPSSSTSASASSEFREHEEAEVQAAVAESAEADAVVNEALARGEGGEAAAAAAGAAGAAGRARR